MIELQAYVNMLRKFSQSASKLLGERPPLFAMEGARGPRARTAAEVAAAQASARVVLATASGVLHGGVLVDGSAPNVIGAPAVLR